MELNLICARCGREMLHDVEREGDNITLDIHPCGACRKVAYQEGWREGVANYLIKEAGSKKGEENGKETST